MESPAERGLVWPVVSIVSSSRAARKWAVTGDSARPAPDDGGADGDDAAVDDDGADGGDDGSAASEVLEVHHAAVAAIVYRWAVTAEVAADYRSTALEELPMVEVAVLVASSSCTAAACDCTPSPRSPDDLPARFD